ASRRPTPATPQWLVLEQTFGREFREQTLAVDELEGAHADAARGEHVLEQVVDHHRVMRQRAEHFERAAKDLRIGLRHAEPMRKDEAIIFLKESRIDARDFFSVHFIRVREERDAISFANSVE